MSEQMDLEDEAHQTIAGSSNQSGDKKRFEVKKVIQSFYS